MIKLRHMRSDDLERLFKWRNDPFIYKNFTTAKPVSKQEHETWFDRILMDTRSRLFIIELIDQKEPLAIGQIRFSRASNDYSCDVSISLPEEHTGKGYGTEAIRQGCRRIDSNIWPGIEILARFQPENCPSKRAFLKAGFQFRDEKSSLLVYRG